ncbi:MAG: Fe(2+)-trafficking protein [Planctomycetota bacterium]|nr:Fe(2+)-trafficking protein [Planctomycetota bacterium]
MDLQQRIAQFENMAKADPTNEMAHFSLGKAYAEAGRVLEAAASYERCVQVAPDMSKAYQMAGECFLKAGQREKAVRLLTEGYSIAAANGDLMPKKAMGELLRSAGVEPPEVTDSAAAAAPEGSFMCAKTGRPGTQLAAAPFKGPVGAWIHENISAETWKSWIGQGTKVINELRLDLSRDQDSETYDRYMREFLGIDDELHERLRSGG